MDQLVDIEIVYAQQQWLKSFKVCNGTTISQALQQAAVLQQFPQLDFTKNKIGIFSKIVALDTIVKPNDRIEIYDPLIIDPKSARKLRAKRQRKSK